MQFSWLSIGKSVVIVYTVSDITVLLCLKDHKTSLDRMYRTRIDLNEITFLYRDLTDKFFPSSLMDHVAQFLFGLRVMTDHEGCVFRAVNDVPALGLSERAVLIYLCVFVIRMNLDTQIVLCVNDLDEKRETVDIHISEKSRLFFPQL